MNTFAWLIRRELWEHRSFFIVPAALAALLLLIYAWATFAHSVSIGVDYSDMSLAEAIDAHPAEMRFVFGAVPLIVPTVLLNVALLLTWFFYLCYTLYSDRKDRSVLFWKSLPVSDAATVLSKLAVAMLALPAIILVAILSTTVIMTLINMLAVALSGNDPWELVITQVPLFSGAVVLAYGLLVQSLWYAPVFGWLLLVSAWAPRVPALWAVLPWLALGIIEGILFKSERILMFIGQRLQPVVPAAFRDSHMHEGHDGIASGHWREVLQSIIDPASFLAEPGLYLGLVLAAVFVAAAIWSRRYRDAS